MKRIGFLVSAGGALLVLGLCDTWAATETPLKKFGGSAESYTGTPAKQEEQDRTAETYTFLGKPRSKDWFDQMYAKFKDDIMYVGGKYVDVGLARIRGLPEVDAKECPAAGTELRASPVDSKILQVIGKEEVLVKRSEQGRHGTHSAGGLQKIGQTARDALQAGASPYRPEVLFHVKGLDTSHLVDGATFPQHTALVYAGTYTYATPIIEFRKSNARKMPIYGA